MNKYFEINKGCALYDEYFAHEESEKKISKAVLDICEKFGIETRQFYIYKDRFVICPTESDMQKFENMMKKTSYGEFKKNIEISKYWIESVKDIEHFDNPLLFSYFGLFGHRWRERLFHIGEHLYCSIESDGEVSTPNFVTEMKASEFYKIVEDYEEGQGEDNE